MTTRNRNLTRTVLTLAAVAMAILVLPAAAKEIPAQLPDPDGKPGDATKPVKVYILAGQSNMVGMGTITGARCRYTGIYLSADPDAPKGPMGIYRVGNYKIASHGVYLSADPKAAAGATVSIYKGAYDPATDYDKAKLAKTQTVALGVVQGTLPAISGPHTHVVRGYIDVPESGMYSMNPGYDDSSYNVVDLDGHEVYRKNVGEQAVKQNVSLEAGKRYAVKITYFKGGATAFWMSRVDLLGKGDLEIVTKRDKKFPNLIDDKGDWTVRKDVYFYEAELSFSGGWLTVPPRPGKTTIGPEVQFGHIMGYAHDEQVLVIKTSNGNRSLGFDYRPPSSGRNQPDNEWEGKSYRLMVEGVRKTLDNIKDIMPGYKGQGYEIAGFAWWQGHKDGGTPENVADYEKNLTNLINDVRAEFKAPKMLAVVATVGFGGYDMSEKYLPILKAQMAVGDPKKHPEFAGNVRSVDTREFWRGIDDSPTSQDYHYNRNAETYLLVGDALGRAMVDLIEGVKAKPFTPAKPAGKPVAKPIVAETPDQIAKAQAALKPIILDGMIPEFIGRNRAALLSEANAEKAKRVSPFLRGTMYGLNELYRSAGVNEYDWHAFGPDLKNTKWDYYSFDPQEKKPKDKAGARYRKVTYPKGMTNWFAVDFDAAKAGWKSGLPPFGQLDGKLEALSDFCTAPFCGCSVTPRSLWEKEVLLVRGTFEIPPLKEGYRYRFVVGGSAHVNAGEGYAIYVNGKLLAQSGSGVGKRQGGQPRGGYIYNDFLKEFQDGKVTIAATSFLRYNNPRQGRIPPRGHFTLWLEEMKIPPLGRAEILKSAMAVPMLSTKWQETLGDEDKFRYDGKFVANPQVLGSWQTIDQVKTIEEFNPEKKMNTSRSKLKEITLKKNGETDEMLRIWSGDTLMDLAANGIAIDDLHAEVIRQGRPRSNNVHDTGDLSRKVADSIIAALASRGTAATPDKEVPGTKKPVKVLQDEFLKLKFGMFIHFNLATYMGVQWVSGYHDPSTFNPGSKIDTDAWADAAVSAGMTYGVLTAKHVSGFCLWDSKYTTYDVMHPDCPYQKDLVAQFIKSFKSRGLKVGLYYCWRHPGFGDPKKYKVLPPECDPATHTLDEQKEFQKAQIAELLTKYPDVFYIWNDALDPKVMAADEITAHIRRIRPQTIASANWWSWGKKGTPYVDIAVKELRHFPEGNKAPGETCWCLEQKWFWNKGFRSKKAGQIVPHIIRANSRNSNFLLNVGPDSNGNIVESSIKTLAEIGKLLSKPKK